MNNKPQTILSDQQKKLVQDLVSSYDIAPSEIVFFAGEDRPTLGYEASCVMANILLGLRDIEIEPTISQFADSVTLKCRLILADGSSRSSFGVANVNELVDGERMSEQQIVALASGRAIRNTLRTAGIDLIKIHLSQGKDNTAEFTGPDRDARTTQLAEVHLLGKEISLITASGDKTAWRSFLQSRYGMESSALLTTACLSDLAAVLKGIRDNSRPAIAA